MKKFLLYTITSSVLFFQCQASEQTPEEFFQTEITYEYVDVYYPGFIKHTEKQYTMMNNTGVKVLASAMAFLSKSRPDDVIHRLAGVYGYDQDSRRLLGIGKLVLDSQWNERINTVIQHLSEQQIMYLNEVKTYIVSNLTTEYNTYQALNQVMHRMHEFHVDALQKEDNFDNDYASFLKLNALKNNNGLYPMHAYLEQHKNQNDNNVHPHVILNMFLAYLFALHKVTTPGS